MLALKYFGVHWDNGYHGLSHQLGVESSLTIGQAFYLQFCLS